MRSQLASHWSRTEDSPQPIARIAHAPHWTSPKPDPRPARLLDPLAADRTLGGELRLHRRAGALLRHAQGRRRPPLPRAGQALARLALRRRHGAPQVLAFAAGGRRPRGPRARRPRAHLRREGHGGRDRPGADEARARPHVPRHARQQRAVRRPARHGHRRHRGLRLAGSAERHRRAAGSRHRRHHGRHLRSARRHRGRPLRRHSRRGGLQLVPAAHPVDPGEHRRPEQPAARPPLGRRGVPGRLERRAQPVPMATPAKDA